MSGWIPISNYQDRGKRDNLELVWNIEGRALMWLDGGVWKEWVSTEDGCGSSGWYEAEHQPTHYAETPKGQPDLRQNAAPPCGTARDSVD